MLDLKEVKRRVLCGGGGMCVCVCGGMKMWWAVWNWKDTL